VSIAALGLSLVMLAVPAVWVSRGRMAVVSRVSPLWSPTALDRADDAATQELRRLQREIVRLEDRIRVLEDDLDRARSFAARARETYVDLGRFVECGIIGHAVNWQDRTFLVDRGAEDGIIARAGCLSGGAVVGTVVEVGPRIARVAMLTERGVRVAARTLESRRTGLASGTGDGCELMYIPRWSPGRARPRQGETLVTSGRLGFFPAGFLVGRVASVGEVAESLHLNVAVVPALGEPPQGRVWILRPLPSDVDEEGRPTR
jgi:cell shape-determining protein MreC